MTSPRKPKSARSGRPPLPRGAKRVVLPAQRISPAAMAVLTPERVRQYGGIGRLLDTALLALPSVERSFGIR